MMPRRGAVFVDRDGVLNKRPPDHQYVSTPLEFRWLVGARDAVAKIARAGFLIVVVSNQRGIARGLVSWGTLHAIEEEIRNELGKRGVTVAGFYYCPHDLDAACSCRKPAPGLLLQAAEEHGIDLERSVMIGDAESDVEAGRLAGCATIRITQPGTRSAADTVVESLSAAAERIVGGHEPNQGGD